MTDKAAPRVTITHHPDVRRSLMTQKAYAEGLRAVYLFTASHQDGSSAQIVSGADKEMAYRVNDLLLPIVKGVGSERAYENLTESLQTLGGSGFLQDYPIEQYIRDAKIDSLYEGTTAIQAQDFFFRKIIRDKGQALAHVAGQISSLHRVRVGRRSPQGREGSAQDRPRGRPGMAATLTGFLMNAQEQPTELYKVGLGSVRFLMSVGDLLIGWLLLRQAEVALGRTRRRCKRRRHRLLQRQGGRGDVLREEHAARAHRRPRHRREGRQRHHGAGRSLVLDPLTRKQIRSTSSRSLPLQRERTEACGADFWWAGGR